MKKLIPKIKMTILVVGLICLIFACGKEKEKMVIKDNCITIVAKMSPDSSGEYNQHALSIAFDSAKNFDNVRILIPPGKYDMTTSK